MFHSFTKAEKHLIRNNSVVQDRSSANFHALQTRTVPMEHTHYGVHCSLLLGCSLSNFGSEPDNCLIKY
jgi:hypothetical protein